MKAESTLCHMTFIDVFKGFDKKSRPSARVRVQQKINKYIWHVVYYKYIKKTKYYYYIIKLFMRNVISNISLSTASNQ